MKKPLLLLFFISISFLGFSQFNTYHPFPDSNAWWGIEAWAYNPSCTSGGNIYISEYDYYLKGDTTINGKLYHRLRYSGEATDPCSGIPDHFYPIDNVQGYVREDTLKHVFFRANSGGKDTLLYDFNLKLREVLPGTYNNFWWDSNMVCGIDSLLIGNTYRKMYLIKSISYNADTNYVFDSIIEGIGSTQGLLERIEAPFESASNLTCFTQNGKTLFPDTTTKCTFFYLGVNNISEEEVKFSIYPNPASTGTNISYHVPSTSSKVLLDLYNPLGQLIKSVTLSAKSNMIAEDVSDLSNGLYYYVLKVDNKPVATAKLIVIKQ